MASCNDLRRFLARPSSYPEPVASVELVETHLSLVALAGDCVYKVKKPVHFEFVDLTTLAARQRVCRDEVRLNRRLAPNVYLGIVPITKEAGTKEAGTEEAGGLAFGGEGPVVDYAVKMRRLPRDRQLDQLLRRARPRNAAFEYLGRLLADFHAESAPVDPDEAAAWPRRIRRNCEENFHETRQFLGTTLDPDLGRFIQRQSRRFLDAAEPLLRQRIASLRIRECHGDLRLEHIYLIEPLTIIDCVEFSERFRNIDTAADLSFCSMELGLYGHHDLNRVLINAYREASGDKDLASLLNFYRSYYAYVRGKVTSLRLAANGSRGRKAKALEASARRLFGLAGSYALGLPRPICLVVFGLMGSGKSSLAEALAERLHWPLVQSDVVRRVDRRASAAGRASQAANASAPFGQGIYTRKQRDEVYARLGEHARRHLAVGQSVILDASFSRRIWRSRVSNIARRMGGTALFVECQCSEEMIARRLLQRERDGRGPSDGRLEIFDQHRADYEPPRELDSTRRLAVATTETSQAVASRVERWLRDSAGNRWEASVT